MHGLDQSNALTVAAQQLSEAKLDYDRAVAFGYADDFSETARHNLGVAKAVYRAAYKAYTNPFGVEKTTS